MIIYGQVPLDYSLGVNLTTVVGTVIGIWLSKCAIRKLGNKNSYQVLFMAFVVISVMVTLMIITIDQTMEKKVLGIPIFDDKSYCN